MISIIGETFSDIYKQLVITCIEKPTFKVSPRGLKTIELINVNLELTNPYSNLFINESRTPNLKYLAGELIWYFSGDNSHAYIKKFSSFWTKIKNEDNTLNSAYGHTLFMIKNQFGFTQWEWAVHRLKNDDSTRQAVLILNMPCFQFENNNDFPCTMYLQFIIRDHKLFLYTNMRSNELYRGIVYDVPFFTLLMQCMQLELKKNYPNLMLGSYNHHVTSIHIYERDLDAMNKMLIKPLIADGIPKIENTPILNSEIINMLINKPYNGSDIFIRWLDANAIC